VFYLGLSPPRLEPAPERLTPRTPPPLLRASRNRLPERASPPHRDPSSAPRNHSRGCWPVSLSLGLCSLSLPVTPFPRVAPLSWGFSPSSAPGNESPLPPGLPRPVRSPFRVSHPPRGFLLSLPPGLLSCRSRSWGSPFRVLLLRSDPLPFQTTLPSCRFYLAGLVLRQSPRSAPRKLPPSACARYPASGSCAPPEAVHPSSGVTLHHGCRSPLGFPLPSRVFSPSATCPASRSLLSCPSSPFPSLLMRTSGPRVHEPGLQSLRLQRDWLAFRLPTLLGFARHVAPPLFGFAPARDYGFSSDPWWHCCPSPGPL